MGDEIHRHDWQPIDWKLKNLKRDTVGTLGLRQSGYNHNYWFKSDLCTGCNMVKLRTRDNSCIEHAIADNFTPWYEISDGPPTGVLVDFELITDKNERAIRWV